MGAKVDTKGIEDLFIETPLKGVGRVKQGSVPFIKPKPVKPALRVAKSRYDPLQGVSSYSLARELGVRHYKFVLTALFWIGVGALIVILGR